MPPRRTAANDLPSVVLFDAAPGEGEFEHFHIEPLRTRTARRNWAIPAHVHHGLHQIFAVERGAVDAVIDGKNLSATAPALLLAPSAAPHAFVFTPGAEGRVLTLRPIRNILDRPELAARLDSVLFARPMILPFAAASARWRDLTRLLSVLQAESARRQDGPVDTAELLLAAILGLAARRAIELQRDDGAAGVPRAALFATFERLVDDTLDRHMPTEAYARQLGVSVSTLDRLCRQHGGVTAARYVRDRLFLEARRRLAYSNRAIQDIAHELGFEDVAYFSRFISRHAKLPPRALRSRLRIARQREERRQPVNSKGA